VVEFERAGRSGVAVAIEIVIASQTVIENYVFVVRTVGENLPRYEEE
jgi:hypothetical protein